MKESDAALFELFLENSKLSRHNVMHFVEGLAHDAPTQGALAYPVENPLLPSCDHFLTRTMNQRVSTRSFSQKALTEVQLASLFAAVGRKQTPARFWQRWFSQKPLKQDQVSTGRLIPSAGGKYPIETYALLWNVKSPFNQKVVYYHPESHALAVLQDAPSFESVGKDFAEGVLGTPALMMILVGFHRRTTEKYGNRGGRFVLMEAGAAFQNLSLVAANEKLAGLVWGGFYDDEILELLQLDRSEACPLAAFLCGL